MLNNFHISSKINVILFGKNGQVASDLIKLFADKSNFTIHNYSSKDIDFSDIETLKTKLPILPKADFIINATAYNAVDKAEEDSDLANLINHQAVKEIANYCQKQNTKFIHYSTNYVFDGNGSELYLEDNTENLKPLSIYGKSKLNGEKAIVNSGCDYLIFRLATVFNLTKENNFVAKIKKLAQTNNELKIVDDQITNPTNSLDIARATIDIIEQITSKNKFTSGIYHLASQKPISYCEFAKEIIADLKNIKIIPIPTGYFPTAAQRPLNGALDVKKIRKDFNINIS